MSTEDKDVKAILLAHSPIEMGETVYLHPDYCGGSYKGDEPLAVLDIGYFERNQLFPFEYECKFPDGHTEWLKGHALVRQDYKKPAGDPRSKA